MMVMKLVKIVIIDHGGGARIWLWWGRGHYGDSDDFGDRSDIMAPMNHGQEENINGDSDDIHEEGGCGAWV